MSRMLSYYKSQLKHSSKSGGQFVTITDYKIFIDEKGKDLINNGKVGVVLTFKNDDLEHNELYWLGGNRYNQLLNLLKILNIKPDDRTKMFGKKLWIVIRHNIRMNGDVEEKRESEIVSYSLEKPNVPSIYEEYDIVAIKKN